MCLKWKKKFFSRYMVSYVYQSGSALHLKVDSSLCASRESVTEMVLCWQREYHSKHWYSTNMHQGISRSIFPSQIHVNLWPGVSSSRAWAFSLTSPSLVWWMAAATLRNRNSERLDTVQMYTHRHTGGSAEAWKQWKQMHFYRCALSKVTHIISNLYV